MLGEPARKCLMFSISKMEYDNKHPLGLINEFYNYSKHSAMISKALIIVDSELGKPSLINPTTNERMKTAIIEYLENSYKRTEKLQEIVRSQISKYRPVVKFIIWTRRWADVLWSVGPNRSVVTHLDISLLLNTVYTFPNCLLVL